MVRQLVEKKAEFTAVVAFNDMSAIGMIRALKDFNFRVPEDVSIVGFDDIEAAAFTIPRLTTVRQPLSEMGSVAAQSVLKQVLRAEEFQQEVMLAPTLVVRESTQTVSRRRARSAG